MIRRKKDFRLDIIAIVEFLKIYGFWFAGPGMRKRN